MKPINEALRPAAVFNRLKGGIGQNRGTVGWHGCGYFFDDARTTISAILCRTLVAEITENEIKIFVSPSLQKEELSNARFELRLDIAHGKKTVSTGKQMLVTYGEQLVVASPNAVITVDTDGHIHVPELPARITNRTKAIAAKKKFLGVFELAYAHAKLQSITPDEWMDSERIAEMAINEDFVGISRWRNLGTWKHNEGYQLRSKDGVLTVGTRTFNAHKELIYERLGVYDA